jgi:hypothetical protein
VRCKPLAVERRDVAVRWTFGTDEVSLASSRHGRRTAHPPSQAAIMEL